MGDRSGIEWTEATWNPISGCSKVSEGCRHCYAETLSHRYKWTTKPWGAQHAAENVQLHPDRLDQPLRWRRPRRIFVNSMSDLFHERVPFGFIAKVFNVMCDARAEHHTFQVLTKRPARMREFFNWLGDNEPGDTPLAVNLEVLGCPGLNVWLGVSVEDQRRYEERIGDLIMTPAAVRFLSCEPLLSAITFGDRWNLGLIQRGAAVNWVICGGESGPGARPMNLAWARAIIAQCRSAGVKVFCKQLGRWVAAEDWRWADPVHSWLFPDGTVWVPGVIGEHNYQRPEGAIAFGLRDRKGANPAEWPEDLRIREYPA